MDVSVPSVQRNVLPHEIMLHQPWLQDITRLLGIIPSLGTVDGTWKDVSRTSILTNLAATPLQVH